MLEFVPNGLTTNLHLVCDLVPYVHCLKKGFKYVWMKELFNINNAFESIICMVETCTLHNKLSEQKELEEYDENPNYIHFKKQ